MQRLFQSLNSCLFPFHLSALLKRGLTVGHTCLMKEMEHVVAVTTCNTSDQLSWPCRLRHTVQRAYILYRQNSTLNGTHSHSPNNPNQNYHLSLPVFNSICILLIGCRLIPGSQAAQPGMRLEIGWSLAWCTATPLSVGYLIQLRPWIANQHCRNSISLPVKGWIPAIWFVKQSDIHVITVRHSSLHLRVCLISNKQEVHLCLEL